MVEIITALNRGFKQKDYQKYFISKKNLALLKELILNDPKEAAATIEVALMQRVKDN